jgi:sugar phosphate isomerase/epimerase
MRLAISNIAWEPQERADIYPVLAEAGVGGLEIAPKLAFSNAEDPFRPSESEVGRFRDEVQAHGLALVSMQSLLYGQPQARLFGDAEEQAAFEDGLRRAIGLAERLEIPNLVMGAPANRSIPAQISRKQAECVATGVFRRLGDCARVAGTKLALEPNPTAYGTNFLTTTGETIAFAALVDHEAVTVNFDLGAMHMNGETGDAAALYRRGATKVSHVHVSEPNLAPAPKSEPAFGRLARELKGLGYQGWFSIEMRAGGPENRDTVRACVAACARQLESRDP